MKAFFITSQLPNSDIKDPIGILSLILTRRVFEDRRHQFSCWVKGKSVIEYSNERDTGRIFTLETIALATETDKKYEKKTCC